ncbi:MAG: YraN family protein [Chloroflexota bacterium]
MTHRTTLGARGEDAAVAELERHGLVIVDRNVRLIGGELDIVARDGDELVFVEVKSRLSVDSVAPDEAVTHVKLSRLGRLAERYLRRESLLTRPWRVDVVAVTFQDRWGAPRVEHVRGAFID